MNRRHRFAGAFATLMVAAIARNVDAQAPPPTGYAPPPPPSGYAPPPPPPGYASPPPYGYPPPGYAATVELPGAHRHDGFYMRLFLGPSWTRVSESQNGIDSVISGNGVTFGFAFGGALTENLILYGELIDSTVRNPSVEVGGTLRGTSGLQLHVGGIGPGLAYYLQPVNLHLGAKVAFTKASATDNLGLRVAETDWGGSVTASVGKEWWASSDWGLGVTGLVDVGRMKDKVFLDTTTVDRPTLTSLTIAVFFTATYN
jgi:hypothetical protein